MKRAAAAKSAAAAAPAIESRKHKTKSREQLSVLEAVFRDDPKPSKQTMNAVATQYQLSTSEVQRWFRSKRHYNRAPALAPLHGGESVDADHSSSSSSNNNNNNGTLDYDGEFSVEDGSESEYSGGGRGAAASAAKVVTTVAPLVGPWDGTTTPGRQRSDLSKLGVLEQHQRAHEAWTLLCQVFGAGRLSVASSLDEAMLVGLQRMFEQHRVYWAALKPSVGDGDHVSMPQASAAASAGLAASASWDGSARPVVMPHVRPDAVLLHGARQTFAVASGANTPAPPQALRTAPPAETGAGVPVQAATTSYYAGAVPRAAAHYNNSPAPATNKRPAGVGDVAMLPQSAEMAWTWAGSTSSAPSAHPPFVGFYAGGNVGMQQNHGGRFDHALSGGPPTTSAMRFNVNGAPNGRTVASMVDVIERDAGILGETPAVPLTMSGMYSAQNYVAGH